MSKIRATNKESGFTLIELIIYMGIFSVASVLLTSMLVTSVKVQNRETSNNELTGQLNLVVQTVQRLVRESSLIEKVYEGTDESSACVSFCSVKLRMEESSLDPTVIRTDSAGIVYVKRGIGSETALTNDRVVVNSLIFTKNEIPKSHATLEVDAVMSSSAGGAPAGPSRELKSVVARTNAAVFDGNVIPNADQSLDLGDVFGDIKRWREGHFSGDVTIESGKVGIGTSSPSDELTVFGNIKIDGSGNGIVFSNGSSITSANGAASGGGWTDSGSIVRLTTDTDKVAIDVPTTTNKLEVNGNTNITGDLTLTGTCDGCGATDTITGTGATGYIAKWNTSGSLTSSAVFNDPSGNIGIGTASPSSKLYVLGDTILEGNVTITGTCSGCAGGYVAPSVWAENSSLNTVSTVNSGRDVDLTANITFGISNTGAYGRIKLADDKFIYGSGSDFYAGTGSQQGTTGLHNIAIGSGSVATFSNSGQYNTAVGSNAISYGNSIADYNYGTTIGASPVGYNNFGNPRGTAVGYAAKASNGVAVGAFSRAAAYGTSIGYSTNYGVNGETMGNSVAIGHNALYSGGEGIIAVGNDAAYCGGVVDDIAIGGRALYGGEYCSNPADGDNVAVGYLAMYNGAQNGNTAVGNTALYSNAQTNANLSANTAMGLGALSSTTTSSNTGLGSSAGASNITGTHNTYIGESAGQDGPANLTNATSIGAKARAEVSNSIVLGNSVAEGGNLPPNVGIGVTAPTQKLEVNGGVMLKNGGVSQPACSSATRGLFWAAQGASGVKDSVQICAKDAANTYAWRTVY